MRRFPAKLVSSAAIRFPEEASARPKLFVHEGARQALTRKLKRAFSGAVVLTITDTRKNIVTSERRGGVLHVHVHHMFLDAPSETVNALVLYLVKNTAEAAEAARIVDTFIAQNRSRLARRPRGSVKPLGEIYDLRKISDELNAIYFKGEVKVQVGWARRGAAKANPRKSIKLGSYDPRNRVISINPVLDKIWIPKYFLAFVVYHEMLHSVFPFKEDVARRELHSPEFIEREKAFERYERANKWEEKNIRRLLRSR